MFTLHNGDCLQVLPSIPSGSIDAIITDLPYGTTDCAWDEVIPFADMWKEVKRVLKSDGVFVTTSSQPFTSALVMSNPSWFKCEWIWNKKLAGNHMLAKYQPMKIHENIIVFSNSSKYNPIMEVGEYRTKGTDKEFRKDWDYGASHGTKARNNMYYPKSILEFGNTNRTDLRHPTQKPLALFRYLVSTYTNPEETVLDIAMGSGTTIEAAIIEGRNSIGIEKEQGYYSIAEKRVKQAVLQPNFFTPSNTACSGRVDSSGSPELFPAEVSSPAKVTRQSTRR